MLCYDSHRQTDIYIMFMYIYYITSLFTSLVAFPVNVIQGDHKIFLLFNFC